jgi:transglutaminase-like putative cysteine protease
VSPSSRGTTLGGRARGEVFHAAVLATAAVVSAWPIALPSTLAAVGAGAAGGALAARRLEGARVRLPWLVALAVALAALARGLAAVLTGSVALATALGPTTALEAGEAVRWAGGAGGLVLGLRCVALRWRAALALEGAAVAFAVASTTAAHRDGMIARPLEVSDWFWSQGLDPVVAFLGVGLAGALLFAAVLARGRSGRRVAVQLAAVAVLGLALARWLDGAADLPALRPPGGGEAPDGQARGGEAGGRGAPGSAARPERGGSGGSGGEGTPFRDDLPDAGQSGRNRPAAVVVFHKDIRPGGGVFYFRHAAFSQFNGSRLVEATIEGVDPDARQGFPAAPVEVPGPHVAAARRGEVATDVALLTEHPRLFALADPVALEPLANPEPARFRRAYRAVSRVVLEDLGGLLGARAGDPSWSDEVWAHYTRVPADRRYARLAGDIVSVLRPEYAEDPIARALTIKRWLEENVTYSMANRHDGEDDPTAAFLFSEEKKGYCVHTAHAAAFLLRALGVPTRVSAGYAVPAANLGGGSSLLVKSGDAHAWAEVHLEGLGWVPVEVTPEQTDVEPTPFEEQDLQQLLGEMARKERRPERSGGGGPRLGDLLRRLAALVPWALGGLVALGYGVKLWRLGAPVVASAEGAPRAAYRAALDCLSASGFVREVGEPRERFARRLEATVPSLRPLTHALVAVALGPPGARTAAPAVARALAAAVAGEVWRAVPWWRWLAGALNPVSWLRSR